MFKPSKLYQLQDPTQFDDELGQGFNIAAPAHDEGEYLIADCWILNAQGEQHPGIDGSPVPIRFEDVVAQSESVREQQLPEGKSWGWR